MKSRFFSLLLSAVLLCTFMVSCKSDEPVMNTETSRIVMDEYMNRDSYAVRVIYDGMNLEFFYVKDKNREFLSTTMGSTQSAVMRTKGYTYYIDVVGKKEVRCIEGDTTDLNYAFEMLNMIYNQTAVNGTLTMTRKLGTEKNPVTIDNYTYEDAETGDITEWMLNISDNMLKRAVRETDGNSFTFEYPDVEESVFYIPDDYNIVGGPRPDFSVD